MTRIPGNNAWTGSVVYLNQLMGLVPTEESELPCGAGTPPREEGKKWNNYVKSGDIVVTNDQTIYVTDYQ